MWNTAVGEIFSSFSVLTCPDASEKGWLDRPRRWCGKPAAPARLGRRGVDQALDLRHERGVLGFVPKRTLPKGILDIDDDQRLLHGLGSKTWILKGHAAIFILADLPGERGRPASARNGHHGGRGGGRRRMAGRRVGTGAVSQGAAARTYNPAHDDCHRLRRSTLDATRAGPGADRHARPCPIPGSAASSSATDACWAKARPSRRAARTPRCAPCAMPRPVARRWRAPPSMSRWSRAAITAAPPCVDAVLAAAPRVVVAIGDPNPLVNGQGLARLRAAGIAVTTGVCQGSAGAQRGFISRMSRGLPWVWMKMAASLDGRSALHNGMSQWITGRRRARTAIAGARAAASC